MADHGQYFDESDPEWPVAQLAARRAPGFVQQPRRLPSRSFLTAAVTVLLAIGVMGPVLARTTGRPAPLPAPAREAAPTEVVPATAPSPVAVRQRVARQTTLTAVPAPRRKPVAPVPPPSRQTEVATVVARPVTSPPVSKPKPAHQVGPNKQLAHPIDPDDR